LGTGFFQGSDPSIEIGNRLFEHRPMRRRAGALQVSERASACERKDVALCLPRGLLYARGRPCILSLGRRILLRFN